MEGWLGASPRTVFLKKCLLLQTKFKKNIHQHFSVNYDLVPHPNRVTGASPARYTQMYSIVENILFRFYGLKSNKKMNYIVFLCIWFIFGIKTVSTIIFCKVWQKNSTLCCKYEIQYCLLEIIGLSVAIMSLIWNKSCKYIL